MEYDDFGDLDDLDGLDDFDVDDEDDSGRGPSTKKIAGELAKEGSKGFMSSLAKKTTEKALPSEYTEYSSEVMDYGHFAKEVVEESKGILEKSIYGLGKEVKKILPFQSKTLENFIERYEEDNAKQREESEEEIRQNAIGGAISDIFDKQMNVQLAMQAKSDSESAVSSEREMVSTKLQTDILTNIDSNMAQQSAFSLQIGKEFYKKSLELKYKSYYLQADLLKTTKDSFKAFSVQFDSIIKNTGLPDVVKANTSDTVKGMMRKGAIDSVKKKLWNNNQYLETVKGRVAKAARSKVKGVADKIGGVSEALSSITGASESAGDSLQMLGGIGAGMLGEEGGSRLVSKFLPEGFIEKVKENSKVKTGASFLSSLANSPAHLFASLADANKRKIEELEGTDGPVTSARRAVHSLFGGVLDLTKTGSLGGTVERDSMMNHAQASYFDRNVHRSITETIPLYLSKILRENTDLTKMYFSINQRALSKGKFTKTEELVYNYEERKLSTLGDYRRRVEDKVLSSNKDSKISGAANSILRSASTGTEDKKVKKILSDEKSAKTLEEFIKLSRGKGIKELTMDDLTSVTGSREEFLRSNLGKQLGPSAMDVHDNQELRKVLNALKESKTANLEREVKHSITEIDNIYPTRGAIAFFRVVSEQSGRGNKGKVNVLTNEQAVAMSKVISRFMETRSQHNPGGKGRDPILQDFFNGEIMSSVSKKEGPIVNEPLTILISDLKPIMGLSFTEPRRAVVDATLGAWVTEVKQTAEFPVETYQTIYDLNPNLLTSRKIGHQQFMEGSTEKESFEAYYDRAAVKQARNLNTQTRDSLTQKATISRLEESGNRLLSSVTERLKEDTGKIAESKGVLGTISVTANVVTGLAKTVTTKTHEASKEVYSKASDKLTDFNEFVGSKLDKIGAEVIKAMIAKMSAIEKDVEELLKKEDDLQTEEIKALNVLLEEAKVNNPSEVKNIEKDIKNATIQHKSKKEVYAKMQENVAKARIELLSVVNDEQDNNESTLKKVKVIFERLIRNNEASLKEAKAKGMS